MVVDALVKAGLSCPAARGRGLDADLWGSSSPDDIAACRGRVASAERFDCYRAVTVGNGDRLAPLLRCVATTLETYASCLDKLEAPADRCAGAAYDACAADVNEDFSACPAVPSDLESAWLDRG